MAEWLVGPMMDKIINTCFEYLQNQFTWQTGMKKELERLREIHPKITAVVSAASRAQIIDQNSALNNWIWQLREAVDEADDLLDEFEYMKHQQPDCWQKLIQVGERALEADPNLKKLAEVVQKLNRISAEVSTFLHLLENIKQEEREQQVELHKARETGSLPKNDLIGRGENKDFVLQWLRQPSDVTTTSLYRNVSLLSIVGHGGMGKTTLLQHVYQDEIRKEFDLKIWVCVSHNFDVKKVIIDMLECLQKKRASLETLDALQESLKSEVMSKKFLLVLDDLWDKEEEVVLRGKWADVLAPLAYGGLGSKILITTRMDSIASMIAKVIRKKKETLRLDGLKEDECLQLLTTHAFDDAENPNDHKKLRSIAGELVKKLYGSPLAAKVIGGVLNSSLDERHWRNVLNSSLGLNDIFPILRLSYIFLPEHLQRLFSFCSIFKEDHIFIKDDLVRMWIAVGFIQASPNNQGVETLTPEDIGERYFDVLIKKSFFDKVSHIGGQGYKMHDLLHELAQSISTQECCRFVGDEKSQLIGIPETIRHLTVDTYNLDEVLKNVGRLKNLRTLRINCYDQDFVDALNEMFKVTRSIRLLHINYHTAEVICENIGYLHHLRYLRFSGSTIKLLPRSLSSLYHLQFLTIDEPSSKNKSNDYFPRDMNNLSNLRYLSHDCLNFPGIGKLKLLQEIKEFRIKNENGYRIEELEHMNEFRTLEIRNLKNVRDTKEAYNAKLYNKRKLTHLFLVWDIIGNDSKGDIGDGELEERVLDNLQPHNYLKTLKIYNYMGVRSAIWMKEAHLINNLEVIELYECLEWEILPPFGQLPFLKVLFLRNMPKLKRIDNKFRGNDMCCCAFPSLENLHFMYLKALVDWFDARVEDLFPCLTRLELSHCPNLQELPYLPPKLEILKINNIGWKTLNCCSISKSIPLKELDVSYCLNITSISLAGEIDKLKSVTIKYCPNLISLGEEHHENDVIENCRLKLDQLVICDVSLLQMEPLRSCTSIRSLTIMSSKNLVSFTLEAEQWFLQLSSSLRELKFYHLESLQSLPSSLTSMSSLEILDLNVLPRLQQLPDLPPSLLAKIGNPEL